MKFIVQEFNQILKFDIKKFCVQYIDSWDTFNDDFFLNFLSNTNKQDKHVLLIDLGQN